MKERFTEFTTAVASAYKKLQQIKKQQSAAYAAYDIKAHHIMTIYHLGCSEEGLTVTELAGLCCEDKAATSRTVEYLVERGYAVHQIDDARRRWRSKVRLTESGREVAHTIDRVALQASAVVTKDIPEEDVDTFYRVFNKMIENMDKFQEQ